MKETELASKVVKYLQDDKWEVYQEVKFSKYLGMPIADIVAVRNNLIWIIECKKSLTLDVMEQATGWKVPLRSVAVPYSKTRYRKNKKQKGGYIGYRIAKDYLKIGIIIVGEFISEPVTPPILRQFYENGNRLRKLLVDEQKSGEYSLAGSKGGGYYTPYQKTIKYVKSFIKSNPGKTFKEIINYIDGNRYHHYSTPQSMKQSLKIALCEWESSWCKIENDKYYIKENQRK